MSDEQRYAHILKEIREAMDNSKRVIQEIYDEQRQKEKQYILQNKEPVSYTHLTLPTKA